MVTAFLAKAGADLRAARTLLRERQDVDAWVVCFHAQQAAEKAIKAALVASGIKPPYIHNLVALAALLPAHIAVPESIDLATLTTYAAGPRYAFSDLPDEPEPTWEEAEAAVGGATALMAFTRDRLELPGDTDDKHEVSDGA